jgi:hypothetical protein
MYYVFGTDQGELKWQKIRKKLNVPPDRPKVSLKPGSLTLNY